MAVNPFQSQSITGYNSSPPPDDGSQTSANKVEWSKHKSKLSDPIKTLAEAINTQAVAAINALALEDAFISTTSATIAEADWHNLHVQLATGNIYFPDPSQLENGWHNYIYNGSTGVVSLQATATGFWLVDGTLASEFLLQAGRSVKPMNTATVWVPVGQVGPTATIPAGVLIGVRYEFLTTCVTATNTIPFDDTIPVATEGHEHINIDFVPTAVGNLLEVEGLIWVSAHNNTSVQVGLFLGTASAAVAVGSRVGLGTDNLEGLPVKYWATSTATDTMTFALNVGANLGAHTVNGRSNGRFFGGVLHSYIKVTEFQG